MDDIEPFTHLDWDEDKRSRNIVKHALDFRDAIAILDGSCLRLPARTVAGETRIIAVGRLGGIAVAIIYTMRGTTLRVISMRKARSDERASHDAIFGR